MEAIYLDNAATSFPKPAGVSDRMKYYLDCVGANVNRSVYTAAQEAGLVTLTLRQRLARLFDFPEPLRPIIRFVFPVSNTALMSFRTTRPSKDLVICFTSTIFYVSIKLVKITSASRIMILLITTAFVLALPTSSAPPFTL